MPPVDEIPLVGCHNDEEMNDSSLAGRYSIGIPSPAQALVQAAAYRIDMDPSRLKTLLQAMKEELVTETWQLDYMDFPSWREMGFPVGLIASIRAVKKEEEQSENSRNNKNISYHSADASEYSSKLVESKAALHDAHGTPGSNEESGEDGQPKRRISDITMSERFTLFGRSMRGTAVSHPALKTDVGNSISPKHLNGQNQDRSNRMSPRGIADLHSSLADMPPTAVRRRRSSKTSLSPMRAPRDDGKNQKQKRRSSITMPLCPSRPLSPTPTRQPSIRDADTNQKQKRRSSITMPVCPSRRPSSQSEIDISDLESLIAKEIDDPSDVESITLGSIVKSKVSDENPEVVYEKSMETIITGNLGLISDTAWDSYLDNDEHTNEEEKVDYKKGCPDDGSASLVLIRRYTVR